MPETPFFTSILGIKFINRPTLSVSFELNKVIFEPVSIRNLTSNWSAPIIFILAVTKYRLSGSLFSHLINNN